MNDAEGAGLENISVVLVETRQPGNIGSAARAMKNMGLTRLKLVKPAQPINDECRNMAAGAFEIVQGARTYSDLDEALSQENLVIGTSSERDRRRRQPVHSPREIAPLLRRAALTQRVALLFGPERSGLRDADLARCQHLVSIPASDAHPVLNLAQAVMVLAYEIHLAHLPESIEALSETDQPATQEEREGMLEHVEAVLDRIGFFSSGNEAHMMKSIRRILSAPLSCRDVRIVRGIMSRIEWVAAQGGIGRKDPADDF